MRLYSWPTYKKRFKPQIKVLVDNLGTREYISPTLRAAGFLSTHDTRDASVRPYEDAINCLRAVHNFEDIELAVYHVWRHSRGYTSEINVYYKLKEANDATD